MARKFTRKTAEVRRDAILSAALPLFATKGFAATTTREIAKAAGVSDALLYKYFPSKKHVYNELVEFCSRQSGEVSQYLSTLERSSETLIKAIYWFMFAITFSSSGTGAYKEYLDRLLLQNLLGQGDVIQAFVQEKISPWVDQLTALYEEAMRAGDVNEGAFALVPRNQIWFVYHLFFARGVFGLPALEVIPWHNGNLPQGQTERVDELVLFALQGLRIKDAVISRFYDSKVLLASARQLFVSKGLGH